MTGPASDALDKGDEASPRPLACQSWLWEMQGGRWTGTVEDMLDTAKRARLDGIELTMAVAARFGGGPHDLRTAVETRGLSLACVRYTMATGFTDPRDAEAELTGLERALVFTLEAGVRRLGLKGLSSPRPDRDRRAKMAHACKMYNEIARRADAVGLTINVHLHSHPDAVVWTPEEWDVFMDGTDSSRVFVCADTGHLLRCGHNPAETIRRHFSRVNHVHLKDAAADGSFPPLGEGILDIQSVCDVLTQGSYEGWIVLEEEHESQIADPVSALRRAAARVRQAGC
jgi:inosose dehydratase